MYDLYNGDCGNVTLLTFQHSLLRKLAQPVEFFYIKALIFCQENLFGLFTTTYSHG
jgi:hypothetical protein